MHRFEGRATKQWVRNSSEERSPAQTMYDIVNK